MADAATEEEGTAPTIPIGPYIWNWQTCEFVSEPQGRGRIVSWIDGDGEEYEPDELDEDVHPVIAIVELLEGEFAGRFVNVDVEEDADDYEHHLLN